MHCLALGYIFYSCMQRYELCASQWFASPPLCFHGCRPFCLNAHLLSAFSLFRSTPLADLQFWTCIQHPSFLSKHMPLATQLSDVFLGFIYIQNHQGIMVTSMIRFALKYYLLFIKQISRECFVGINSSSAWG